MRTSVHSLLSVYCLPAVSLVLGLCGPVCSRATAQQQDDTMSTCLGWSQRTSSQLVRRLQHVCEWISIPNESEPVRALSTRRRDATGKSISGRCNVWLEARRDISVMHRS